MGQGLVATAGYMRAQSHGDNRADSGNLGLTRWFPHWILGAGVSWGGVSYQLLGPGAPLATGVLVDYDSWNAHLALTQYLNQVSGLNLRLDHERARDIWDIDGITLSYFREW